MRQYTKKRRGEVVKYELVLEKMNEIDAYFGGCVRHIYEVQNKLKYE